jgi:hypothetical protein
MDPHPIKWTAPEPLWIEATDRSNPDRALMPNPSILRFATDDFMPLIQGVMATDPRRLGEYRLVKETWRGVLPMTPAVAPKDVFALPLQRQSASRRRINGLAPASLGRKLTSGADTTNIPLKLYQPAHQRHYLVTSCLVCQIQGMPDRKVDSGKQEEAGFVMRRLLPLSADPANPSAFDENSWQEYAWVPGTAGNSWQLANPGDQYVTGEEILPMFGLKYTQDDQRQRRLFAGLIPAGKREAYLAATATTTLPATTAGGVAANGDDFTARKILLRTKVIEPWKQLLDRAVKAANALETNNLTPPTPDTNAFNNALANARKVARINLQESAYFVLADFAEFLQTYLRPIWDPLVETPGVQDPTEPRQLAALNALRSVRLDPPSPAPPGGPLGIAWNALLSGSQKLVGSLPEAFKLLVDPQVAKSLDAVKTSYDPSAPQGYPPFVFPLADPEDSPGAVHAALPRSLTIAAPVTSDETTELADAQAAEEADMPSSADALDQLAVVLARALAAVPSTAPQPAVPLAAQTPADPLTGWFVIRCIYRRPACGPLHDDVVSARTEAFQLAGFFDSDAPARPIRIGLPIDTSPAGLRKFDKNTAFVLSDMLCGHVKRAKGMSFGDLVMSVLPFPFHKSLDGGNSPCGLGTICSLSIPIITICAFIILIIMVSLLDIIFSWTPYFMLCFPVKGMDGKKS